MRRSILSTAGVFALLLSGWAAEAGAQSARGPVTEGSARDLERAADQRLARAAQGGARTARGGASAKADPDDGGHDDGDHQHGSDDGHLPGSKKNVALVGRLDLTDKSDNIADVTGDPRRGFAYLSGRGVGADCAQGGGIHVASIADARKPRKIGFIKFPTRRFPGEGVHAIRLNTRYFNGYVLGGNNEVCSGGPNLDAGLSLYDVTKPSQARRLAVNFGDKETRGTQDAVIHDYHSIFLWQAGDRAFAMGTDNDEQSGYDVDIFEITNPRAPKLLSETGRPDWPPSQINPNVNTSHGQQPLNHDFQVRRSGRRWIANVAYWDAGYVVLDVTDPANPVFSNNTKWSNPDPVFPEFQTPEGNAHQVWYDAAGRYFIGTDEDFSPYRTTFEITTGPHAGQSESGEFGWTVPIATLPDGKLNGPTVYGGYACPDSPGQIPDPPTNLEPGEEKILVVQRGPVNDPNNAYEACFFSQKVEAGEEAGYDAVIVANHHSGASGGAFPDATICGGLGHQYTPKVRGACIGHRALHLLFKREPRYELPYPQGDPGDHEPNVGEEGEKITMSPEFDGWGYAHLFDAGTQREIDTYAIEEATDERFAQGFGALSVHEVQFSRYGGDLAWFSWYSGGVRVVKVDWRGMTEVGHFIDEEGSDFWGIDFGRDARGREYALASDRDDGLWIFSYTGG